MRRLIFGCLLTSFWMFGADDFSGWRAVTNAPGLEYRWAPEGGLYKSCNLEFRDRSKMKETKAKVTVQYILKGQRSTHSVSLWMYDKPTDRGRVESCDSVESAVAASLERK